MCSTLETQSSSKVAWPAGVCRPLCKKVPKSKGVRGTQVGGCSSSSCMYCDHSLTLVLHACVRVACHAYRGSRRNVCMQLGRSALACAVNGAGLSICLSNSLASFQQAFCFLKPPCHGQMSFSTRCSSAHSCRPPRLQAAYDQCSS